ncbi:hypothetical protein MY11210_004933 [Beauveria gryllotalpidicola]
MSNTSVALSHRPHRDRQVPAARGFRNGRQPRSTDVFIAVMGITGAGKSSFIATCSGKPVQIGDNLQGCTSQVDVFAYEMTPDRTVFLIDTPGFDDTNRSDTQVLTEIARWLGDSYRNKILLHGIIYLHRITDVRMSGAAKGNLLMFRRLCGDDYLKKVTLVTTMWDKVPDSVGASRERELKETPEFLGKMISRGSICCRYYNNAESGRDIIHKLVNHNHGRPIATDIQRELVDESRELGQTAAGQEVEGELGKARQKWAAEKRRIEKDMHEAKRQHDREAEKMLREERDRYADMMKKIEADSEALRATMENLLAQRNEREVEMKDEMKQHQRAHKDELKRLKKKQRELERQTAELKSQQARNQEARQNGIPKQQGAEQTQTVQAAQSISRATGTYSKYSLAIVGTVYTFTGQSRNQRSHDNPANKMGSGYLDACTFGDDGEWVARYTNNKWSSSVGLTRSYPYLGSKIEDRGVDNLEFCILGRQQRHFARWLNGSSCWHTTNDAMSAKIKEYGSQIRALAFGYDDTYLLSHGNAQPPRGLGWALDLKGHYPQLSSWLDEDRSVSIVAVALDFDTPGNYAVVYYRDHENTSTYYLRWSWSDSTVASAIRTWWNSECKA